MARPACIHIVLAISLLSYPLAAQQAQTGNISGQINVTKSGSPNKRILVSLEARGTPITSTYADNQGGFFFGELVANPYRLTIDEPEFEPVSVTVMVNPAEIRTTFARIMLVPRRASTAERTAPRPSGSNPRSVDSFEYTRKFPKKAVDAYEAGLKAEREGKSEDALKYYKQALNIAPELYPARNNLGTLYLSRGDTQAASNEFQKVISGNQSDASGYFNMTNLLLLTQRYAEAETMVQEGLRRQPDSAFGKFVEGSLLARTARLPEAERSLRQAIQLDPLMSKVHLELVNLYLHEKNIEAAKKELTIFIDLFPKDALAEKAREVLKRLEQTAPH